MKNSKKILNIFYSTACFIFFLILLSIMLSIVGWVIRIPITGFHFPIAIILTALLNYFFQSKYSNINKKEYIVSLLFGIIIIFFSVTIANIYMDISYDGVWYHSISIIKMKEGWNPIYEFVNSGYYGDVYIDSYPCKGIWAFGAVIYAFFQNLDSAKIISTLMAFTVSFYSISIYGQFAKKKSQMVGILLCSLLIGFNPIYISQMFTNYIDSTLGLVLIFYILLFNSLLLKQKSFRDNDFCILIIMCISLMANIKLTGLYFAGVFFIFFVIFELYKVIKNKDYKYFYRIFFTGFIGLCLALFIGINPYITNIVRGHNIFYPIFGSEKIEVMGSNIPEALRNKSNLEKLLKANLSKTTNGTKLVDTELQNPFNIGLSNFEKMNQDTRIGAFGAAFPLIIYITIFSLIISLKDLLKKEKNLDLNILKKTLFYSVLVIAVNALMFSESWWGRYYVPIWIIPILITIYYIVFFSGKAKYHIISTILIIVMLYNVIGTFNSIYSFNKSHSKSTMNYIESIENKNIIYYDYDPELKWECFFDTYFNEHNINSTAIIDTNNTTEWDYVGYKISIEVLD